MKELLINSKFKIKDVKNIIVYGTSMISSLNDIKNPIYYVLKDQVFIVNNINKLDDFNCEYSILSDDGKNLIGFVYHNLYSNEFYVNSEVVKQSIKIEKINK